MTQKYIYILILTATLAVCYAITLAPGLTWANGSADGGDLITAAATEGVAHPSGYPLYLLLARAFQLLPFGTLAFRTNLLSAICAILMALTLQTWLRCQFTPGVAFAGALAFGLAPVIWSKAVVTEVYALQSLLLVLFLWTMFDKTVPGGEWTRGLLFGLAAANHLTTLLFFPLLLLRTTPEPRLADPPTLVRRGLACALGLSLYLTLPLRAATNPPVNWGNPVNLDGFWWLVSGRLYADYSFAITPADALLRLQGVGGLFLEQFTIVGVLLGVYGLFTSLPRRLLLATLWVFLCSAGFAVFYGSYDSKIYLLPCYLVFTIWLAYGLQDILHVAPQKLGRSLIPLIVFGLLIRIPFTHPSVDASHNPQAENFGTQFAAQTPPHAILFANSDEPVFALWYFHYALSQRPDVAVIAEELLPYDWYIETLSYTYPTLKIPPNSTSAAAIATENPGRPACRITSAEVVWDNFCD